MESPSTIETMAMIIEELNHCGGNIPMAPNLLIMFDMVEFGTPEQIQYAIDYYKENGYPPIPPGHLRSPRPAPPTSG